MRQETMKKEMLTSPPMTKSTPKGAVNVEGISMIFSRQGYSNQVLDSINLQIKPGELACLLGPSGCGKSTLLRALARLLSPNRGSVTLEGTDLRTLSPRKLARRLAILPQHLHAPEGIRVSDLVMRGRIPWRSFLSIWRDEDRDACEAALRAVGMQDHADRDLSELSGGQRQRAWLSLVLAQQTPYLLLDEPTTYLDLTHQMEVLRLLRQLNQHSGTTVVSVLHDLNLAARYSDHLVLLGKGELVATGRPTDILTQKNLAYAFGLDAQVIADPITHTPLVVPLEPKDDR